MAKILVDSKEFIDICLLTLLRAISDDDFEKSDLADDTLDRLINTKTTLVRHALNVDPRLRQLSKIISPVFKGSMEHSIIEIMRGRTNESKITNTCQKYLSQGSTENQGKENANL